MPQTANTSHCCMDRVGSFCFRHESFPAELPKPDRIIFQFELTPELIQALSESGVRTVVRKEVPAEVELDEGTPVMVARSVENEIPAEHRKHTSTVSPGPRDEITDLPIQPPPAPPKHGPYTIQYVSSSMLLRMLEKQGWHVRNPHIHDDKPFFTFELERGGRQYVSNSIMLHVLWLRFITWRKVRLLIAGDGSEWKYFWRFSGFNDCPGIGRDIAMRDNRIKVIDG